MRANRARAAVDAFQRQLCRWADTTFPEATLNGILLHLKKEFRELNDALIAGSGDEEEVADMVMLLFHYAHKRHFSLFQAILDKFEVVKKRRWGKPDRHGNRRHL